jgi:hypothetical protein
MSEAVSEAEQKRRDKEWRQYERNKAKRSWRPDPSLDFDQYGRYVGKPSDIFTKPLETEPPTMRRKRNQGE